MINRSVLILAAFFVLAWIMACQTATDSTSVNSNRTTTNTAAQPVTNTSQSNANQPATAKTEESAPSSGGSLATPTDTYKTGYAARKNKDIATLKRVLSKEAQEFLTEVGKEEKKTLDDQLKAMADRPQAATDETRNEKITGDRATLEYQNESGKWVTMDFVKEGNEWKITLPKAQ